VVTSHAILNVQQGNPTAKYQTIQSAVNAAKPGDTIVVSGGTYHEAITVTTPGLTIEGAAGAKVVIEPPTHAKAENGITVEGTTATPLIGFKLSNVEVDGFAANGVYLINVANFKLSHVTTKNDAEYGLYPVLSSNGQIDHSTATGSNDSGIYVGQSNNVKLQQNTVYNNVNGIEVENSSDVVARDNTVVDNTVGILVDLLPAGVVAIPGTTPVVTSLDNLITDNQVYANNRPNTAPSDDIASIEPPGTGIVIVGGTHTRVSNNTVMGNAYAGIALISGNDLLKLAPPGTPGYTTGVDPNPHHTLIQFNQVHWNGFVAAPAGFPASADLVWTGSGQDNHWRGNHFATSTPAQLP
jgi:parallel beta-helix repeat protein